MKDSKQFKAKRENFIENLIQLDESIEHYVGALKKQSSEELLSGSSELARKYLDEIILLESNTNELRSIIENLVNLINESEELAINKSTSPKPAQPKKRNFLSNLTSGSKKEVKEPVESPKEEIPVEQPVVKQQAPQPPQVRAEFVEEPEELQQHVVQEPVKPKQPPVPEPVQQVVTPQENIVEEENVVSEQPAQVKKETPQPKKQVSDSKIPILKSLIYLGGIANEEEISKYMKQYNSRNGEREISIEELKSSLDSMYEKEMISVDPLDDNIEILQNGIDYLAKHEI